MGIVIYLDHNATTPVLPEVLEAMMPYLTTEWGNPSSSYKFGAKLKTVIETAREQVAELIGAHPLDVIFTSCATESNNTAIAAALRANRGKRHIVTSQVEHSSVVNYCMALEKEDCGSLSFPRKRESTAYRVTYLPVDRDGLLKLADLEAAITDERAVVSLMWANNETGVLFPVEQIAQICRSRGVLYHCDAAEGGMPWSLLGTLEVIFRPIKTSIETWGSCQGQQRSQARTATGRIPCMKQVLAECITVSQRNCFHNIL